jgi:hypothetical protein
MNNSDPPYPARHPDRDPHRHLGGGISAGPMAPGRLETLLAWEWAALQPMGTGPDNRGPAKVGGILTQPRPAPRSKTPSASSARAAQPPATESATPGTGSITWTSRSSPSSSTSPDTVPRTGPGPSSMTAWSLPPLPVPQRTTLPTHRGRRHDPQLPALLRLGRGHRRGIPDRACRHRVVSLHPGSRHP